jgi:hypothetical protein
MLLQSILVSACMPNCPRHVHLFYEGICCLLVEKDGLLYDKPCTFSIKIHPIDLRKY